MASQRLAFAPAAGTSLSKSFETTLEFDIDKLSISIGGEELGYAWAGIRPEAAKVVLSARVDVVDSYGEVAGGRPLYLERSFEKLSFEMTSAGELSWSRHDDDLEGATLIFTWDADAQAYSLASDIKSLDLIAISHRGEDMDLRALLPSTEVRRGAQWSVAGTQLIGVFWPGLDTDQARGKFRETLSRSMTPADMDQLFDELIEQAELLCTYLGQEEVDGKTLHAIELAADVDHEMNIVEALRALLMPFGFGHVSPDLIADIEFEARVTGKLLWDAQAGHFHSYVMDLEYQLCFSLDGVLGIIGGDDLVLIELAASGVLRRRARAE